MVLVASGRRSRGAAVIVTYVLPALATMLGIVVLWDFAKGLL